MFKIKENHVLKKRKETSRRLQRSHPDRVPIIIEHHKTGQMIRFLAPEGFCMGKLIHEARKHLNKDPFSGTWLMTDRGSMIPRASDTLFDIYDRYGDEDGFLYLW